MRMTLDFILIIAFFVAYHFFGIYVATGAIMAGSAIQVFFHRWHTKEWDTFSVRLAIIVWILGTATLVFHNSIFIKWKPSILYWGLSAAFLSTQYFGKEPTLKKLLGSKIVLPNHAWLQLNLAWGLFFLGLGLLNVYVIYHFTTTQWVYFKVFGCVGLSLIFIIAQGCYMARYIPKETSDES